MGEQERLDETTESDDSTFQFLTSKYLLGVLFTAGIGLIVFLFVTLISNVTTKRDTSDTSKTISNENDSYTKSDENSSVINSSPTSNKKTNSNDFSPREKVSLDLSDVPPSSPSSTLAEVKTAVNIPLSPPKSSTVSNIKSKNVETSTKALSPSTVSNIKPNNDVPATPTRVLRSSQINVTIKENEEATIEKIPEMGMGTMKTPKGVRRSMRLARKET